MRNWLIADVAMGHLLTLDGAMIVPKILLDKDKKSRDWYNQVGPIISRSDVGPLNIFTMSAKCTLALLTQLLFASGYSEPMIRTQVADYDHPASDIPQRRGGGIRQVRAGSKE
jgi:hypothetical protein